MILGAADDFIDLKECAVDEDNIIKDLFYITKPPAMPQIIYPGHNGGFWFFGFYFLTYFFYFFFFYFLCAFVFQRAVNEFDHFECTAEHAAFFIFRPHYSSLPG